jgi:hypothetical protein
VKYRRFWLEQHDIAHVLATRRNDTLVTTGFAQSRADDLVAALPTHAWQRISAAPVRTDHVTTTGRVSRSGCCGHPGAVTGCWPGATSPTRPRSPTTSATGHTDPPSPTFWRAWYAHIALTLPAISCAHQVWAAPRSG